MVVKSHQSTKKKHKIFKSICDQEVIAFKIKSQAVDNFSDQMWIVTYLKNFLSE